MGKIVNIEYKKDKALVTVESSFDEVKALEGENNKIYLFTSENITEKTKVAKRGKSDSSTYMLVPLKYRKEMLKGIKGRVRRIDSEDKIFFVYVMDKQGR